MPRQDEYLPSYSSALIKFRMSVSRPEVICGSVASLHIHAASAGQPLTSVPSIEAVEEMGIRDDPRYFGRRTADGEPSSRQVTLMEREQMAEHAVALGVQCLPPGTVRANIETFGIRLVPLVDKTIQVGDAILYLTKPRDPCEKMDRACQGLRALMNNHRQGVLARVVRSGTIRVGDLVTLLSQPRVE